MSGPDMAEPQDPQHSAVESFVTDRERLSSYAVLLRNRNYRLWFTSSLGSTLGDWVGLFALQALVVSLSEPQSRVALFALGGIMMARLLPSILIGPVAGVWADRYDRRHLMVFTDIARGVLFLVLAFSRDLVAFFALTFAIECLSLLYLSAKDASLPQIVRRQDLAEANQLNLLVTWGPLPFGGVAAALMIPVAALLHRMGLPEINPAVLALVLNAVTFFIAGAIISRVVLPERKRAARAEGEQPAVLKELREGLQFINDLPLIRSLILGIVGVAFGAGVVLTLGPEFVRTTLGGRSTDWFTLMTAVGGGLLAGIVLVPVVTERLPKARVFPVCLTATAALATVTAVVSSLTPALVLGALLGFSAGMGVVIGYTLLHEHTRDEMRARTFAAFHTGVRVSVFVALAVAPFVAGAIGNVTVIVSGQIIRFSGIRITILVGGLVALWAAQATWRGMYRALREEKPDRAVRLPGAGRDGSRNGGLFIAFEGVEGSGKSTQVARLAETLRSEGHEVVVTREPGGSAVAERIRALLLDPNAEAMDTRTEALLYAAARAEHVRRVIEPALAEGRVVISDRFLHSSLAYQGHARDLGESDVFEINRWAISGFLPDVVILLHLDPEDGLHRIAERARRHSAMRLRSAAPDDLPQLWAEQASTDRLEREGLDFHRRVAEGYLSLARSQRERFVVVDASADAGTVARQVRSGLHPWLPLPERREGHEEGGRGEDRPEAAG